MRIVTEQAPSAKPISVSAKLTTDWQTIIDVPDYDVPVVGFGTERRIAPGVAEISSSLLASNTSSQSAGLYIRIIRAIRPLINAQTQANYSVFSGGEGYADDDLITLSNGAEVTVNSVDGSDDDAVLTFEITSVGNSVAAGDVLTQVASDGPGEGFSITVAESNLSTTIGYFSITENIPVEPRDTLVFPLNGQFLTTGDRLQVKSSDNNLIDVTLSYTEGQAEEDDLPEGAQ